MSWFVADMAKAACESQASSDVAIALQNLACDEATIVLEDSYWSSHGVTCAFAIDGCSEINGAVWVRSPDEGRPRVELIK